MQKSPKKTSREDPFYPPFHNSKTELDNKHLVDGILKRLKVLESRKDGLRVVQESLEIDDKRKDLSTLIDAFTSDAGGTVKRKSVSKNPTLIP